MVDEMKRIKLVNWILSLHPTKSYEVKVNSFCMCKSLIKINIVQTQLWEKPIYKLCLQKQHILPGLFIRKLCYGEMNYFDTLDSFFFFWGKKWANQACQNIHFTHHSPHFTHQNTLTHGPFITSLTNMQSILICSGGQQTLTAHLL